jgi:large subunit ribosomal protein L29
MQAQEIRKMSAEEIQSELLEAHRQLFALRRDHATGRLEDTNRIKAVKSDIARLKTILRERQLSVGLVEGSEAE